MYTERCVEGVSDNNDEMSSNETMSNATTTFVLKNNCMENPDSILILGLINYAIMIFLLPTIYFWLGSYLEKHAVMFDEDEQTTQDYSLTIKNPPRKATNPDDWRTYFETNFSDVKVVSVTCNLSNDLLVKALVRRREVLRMLEMILEPGVSLDVDNLALLAAKEADSRSKYLGALKALFVPGLPELLSQLVALNTSIKVSELLNVRTKLCIICAANLFVL